MSQSDRPGFAYRQADRPHSWTKLRKIGETNLARAAILVPVIGYFIIFNRHLIDYLEIHTQFCNGQSCQVTWRILLLYFGSCSAGIGTILFAWLCPDIIKRYSTSREFFREDALFYLHPHNLSWLLDSIGELTGRPYTDSLDLEHIISTNAALGKDHTQVLSGPMAAFFNAKNQTMPFVRLLIFVCYAAAFVLLFIPTAWTFVRVLMIASD